MRLMVKLSSVRSENEVIGTVTFGNACTQRDTRDNIAERS
jgi:hypothetical protein